MKSLKRLFRIARDRSGATAIEYALIGGIICIAIVAGATAVGQSTNGSFESVKTKVWGES